MARTINTGQDFTVEAGADLSSDQFKLVTLAGVLAGAGAVSFPLQNKPSVSGQAAALRKGGTSKIVAGAAFAVGVKLAANAAGLAITALATNNVVGIASEAAAGINEVVTMEVVAQGIA